MNNKAEERDCKGRTRAEHEALAKSAAETAEMLGTPGPFGGHLSRPFTPCAPEDRDALAAHAEPDMVMIPPAAPNAFPSAEAFDALAEKVRRLRD
jgi:hypothetical protein